jgi:uroporphyrinogen decarboxylase
VEVSEAVFVVARDKPVNARELVNRALSGLAVPRPAVGPLAVHYCARLAGVSLRDYTLSSGVLADCVIRYHERFQPDAVWLSADTWVNAQAMGARVAFPGEDQPLGGTGEPLIKTTADIERIPAPDPSLQGRWPLMLEAMRRARAALGPKVFLVGCFDQYPFSLACAAMGLERIMLAVNDDLPLVKALMDRCAEYTVAYACALAEAGADMLSGGASPATLLGPKLYREVALPFEQRAIAAIKARTALPVSLHMCGNATPILADLAKSGADVLELDHRTNLREACRILPRHIAIWGNLDPVGVLAQGSPQDVTRAANEFLQTLTAAGHDRFVLSSGCTLAVETPETNLHALIRAASGAPVSDPACA